MYRAYLRSVHSDRIVFRHAESDIFELMLSMSIHIAMIL